MVLELEVEVTESAMINKVDNFGHSDQDFASLV